MALGLTVHLALALTLAGSATARPMIMTFKRVLKAPETIYGYTYPAGTEVTMQQGGKTRSGKTYPDRVYAVKLPADREIYGVTWLAGTVVDFSHDAPMEFHLVKGQVFHDFVAPDSKSSIVYWDGSFKDIRGSAAVERQLHGNGRTRSRRLLAEEEIRGLELAAKTEVTFHPNGKLMSGTLEREQTLKGLTLSAKSRVVFYASGKLMKAHLAKVHVVDGVSAVGPISFYESGKIFAVTLAEAATVGGQSHPRYSQITLHPDGKWRGGSVGGKAPVSLELPIEPEEPLYD
jgi:hypothetical protein